MRAHSPKWPILGWDAMVQWLSSLLLKPQRPRFNACRCRGAASGGKRMWSRGGGVRELLRRPDRAMTSACRQKSGSKRRNSQSGKKHASGSGSKLAAAVCHLFLVKVISRYWNHAMSSNAISARSVAVSYKPPTLVNRVRLPACAHLHIDS